MSELISEKEIENKVIKKLENLGWISEIGDKKSVFMQNPRTKEEKKLLNRKRPDFILYDPRSFRPIAIIETKKPGKNLERALIQAEEYATLIGVNIIFAYDGFNMRTRNIKFPTKELTFGDTPISDFLPYDLLYKFEDKWKIDFEFGKKISTEKAFINEMKNIEQILRQEGLKAGDERFTEFAKLLFLKLISQKKENSWIWENIKRADTNAVKDIINSNLKRLNQNYKMDKYGDNIKINSSNVVKKIVDRLSLIDFVNTSLDVKGSAFEYFLNYRGKNDDLAQYFTPREIVRFLIELANPKPGEKIYDPFCGSGGILIKAFDYVKNQITNNEELEILKHKQLFGSDISTIAYVAKMNMILAGDGHTNILRQMNGSLPNKRTDEYDLVITNIPFTLPINVNVEGMMYNVHSNNGNSISLQHSLDSLKKQKGSRAAIVVPEQVIFLDEILETRKWMSNNYDIKIFSLPQGVFLPYAIAKSCILYLEYKGKPGNINFYEIDYVGFTPNNSKSPIDKNDLNKYIENNKSIKSYEINREFLEKNKYIFKPNFKQNDGISIKEILEVSKKDIDVKPNNDYFEITVKNHGKGITQRVYDKKMGIKTKKGSEFGSKRYVIEDETFVYSTLDARNGGFGRIGQNLQGALYTNTYVCFKLKEEYRELDLDFLAKILSSDKFKNYFTRLSNGTTNRRSVKKEELLDTKLPYSKRELLEMSKKFSNLQGKLDQIKNKEKLIIEEQERIFNETK